MKYDIDDGDGLPRGDDMGCLIVLITIFAMWLLSGGVHGAEVQLPVGTVLATKNRIEALNTSPGNLNHLAIIVSPTELVESQAGIVERAQGKGVIRTTLDDFLARDYSTVLALVPRDPSVGERAAATAETLVGLPFRQLSSLPGVDRPFVFERRGMNCDSVIRYSYRQASGERLRRMRIPDRALEHDELFEPPITLRNEPSVQTVVMRRRVMVRPVVRVRPVVVAPMRVRPIRPVVRPGVRVDVRT